eukprot:600810-Prymnesium_polylepis.1
MHVQDSGRVKNGSTAGRVYVHSLQSRSLVAESRPLVQRSDSRRCACAAATRNVSLSGVSGTRRTAAHVSS